MLGVTGFVQSLVPAGTGGLIGWDRSVVARFRRDSGAAIAIVMSEFRLVFVE